MSLKVYATTCDKYLATNIPHIFLYQFRKHWSVDQEVVFVGHNPPPFEQPLYCSFMSVSREDGTEFPLSMWSDMMIAALKLMDDDIFCFMFDDAFLDRDVDIPAVELLYHIMQYQPQVLKIDLAEDRLHTPQTDMNFGRIGNLDIICSAPNSPYHMSLWPGLWNRHNMLKVLIPGETPWEIELAGSPRLSAMPELQVWGTKQMPLSAPSPDTTGVRSGQGGVIKIEGLPLEDQVEIRKMGWV